LQLLLAFRHFPARTSFLLEETASARGLARVCLRQHAGLGPRWSGPPEPAQFDILGEFFVRFVIFVVKIRKYISE
jgi:hypothetical protein